MIRDGENGYLIPAGDPRALADRVLALRRSTALRKTMSDAGRSTVRERFSFAHQGAAYKELLAGLAGRRLDRRSPSAAAVALAVGSD